MTAAAETPIAAGLIARIRKLLALAEQGSGATEAEAAAALEKAHDLLLRHNLSLTALERADTAKPPERVIQELVKIEGAFTWPRDLLGELARHNFCTTVYLADRAATRVWVIGRPTNIAATRAMFAWLTPQLLRLYDEEWRRYQAQPEAEDKRHRGQARCRTCGHWWAARYRRCVLCGGRLYASHRMTARTFRAAFMAGAIQRLAARLREQRQGQTQTAQPEAAATTALVRATDIENDMFLRERYGDRLRQERPGQPVHADGYSRGYARGADLTLGDLGLPGTLRALPARQQPAEEVAS